ncbi:hypothetical protein AB1Y20_015795 [Prymnesium parvum]|uniref:COX assembly mitochondrial protein n=1 Tax=Prymnesium parvum TaxID=97485 RepID=A0AB34K1G6_PRYPA|mmetsp:Transcript_50024/g.124406  ORF Transcript_50024/g.124406 Transcript_50024/m.124406 type:complete len:111 (+) Transcript_50024:49-381(+)
MAENKGDARDDRLQGPTRLLRNRDRANVIKELAAEAREKCHETRNAYVQCASGRTLTLVWACKGVLREFNECLHQYTTEEQIERRIAETAARWKAENSELESKAQPGSAS